MSNREVDVTKLPMQDVCQSKGTRWSTERTEALKLPLTRTYATDKRRPVFTDSRFGNLRRH